MNMKPQDLPSKADDMFCFAIYSAWHDVNRAYAPLLKDIGLTYPQYITMTALWEGDGISVGALTKRLNMETNTLTPLLKRLETMGHLTRKRGKTDERQVFVHLTPSGRALHSKAPNIVSCMVEATGMSAESLGNILKTLQQLSKNLRPGDARKPS